VNRTTTARAGSGVRLLAASLAATTSLAGGALAGTTELVSRDVFTGYGAVATAPLVVSGDRRFVLFMLSYCHYGCSDEALIRDRWEGTTTEVCYSSQQDVPVAISRAGRFVAFDSAATDLIAGDAARKCDVFVRERRSGTTELVSVARDGGPANGNSTVASMTPDGRLVVFRSAATNLVAGDGDGKPDVFVFDRQTRTTERVSASSKGVGGDRPSGDGVISAGGRVVVFDSRADNLVPHDANNRTDVFAHVR
jgi:hypothetical protein